MHGFEIWWYYLEETRKYWKYSFGPIENIKLNMYMENPKPWRRFTGHLQSRGHIPRFDNPRGSINDQIIELLGNNWQSKKKIAILIESKASH